jgi:hypothetical protein
MKKLLAKFKIVALLTVVGFALSGCALTDLFSGGNSILNQSKDIGDLNDKVSCPVGGVETPANGAYVVPTTKWDQNDLIDVTLDKDGNTAPTETNTFKYFRIDQEAKIPAYKLEPGLQTYVDRRFRGNGFKIEDTEENKVQNTMFVPLVTQSYKLMTNIINPSSRWPRSSQSEIYTMNRSFYFGDTLSDFDYYAPFQWPNVPAIIFILYEPAGNGYAQLPPAERQAQVPVDLTSNVMRFDVYYSVAKYNDLYDRKTCQLKGNLTRTPPQQFTYCRSTTPFQSASATASEADRVIRTAQTPLSRLARCLGTGVAYAADSQSDDLSTPTPTPKTSLLGRAVARIRSWFGVSADAPYDADLKKRQDSLKNADRNAVLDNKLSDDEFQAAWTQYVGSGGKTSLTDFTAYARRYYTRVERAQDGTWSSSSDQTWSISSAIAPAASSVAAPVSSSQTSTSQGSEDENIKAAIDFNDNLDAADPSMPRDRVLSDNEMSKAYDDYSAKYALTHTGQNNPLNFQQFSEKAKNLGYRHYNSATGQIDTTLFKYQAKAGSSATPAVTTPTTAPAATAPTSGATTSPNAAKLKETNDWLQQSNGPTGHKEIDSYKEQLGSGVSNIRAGDVGDQVGVAWDDANGNAFLDTNKDHKPDLMRKGLKGEWSPAAATADEVGAGLPGPAEGAPPTGDAANPKTSNSGVVMDPPRLHREAVTTCQQKCDQGVDLKEFIEDHNPVNIALNEKKVDGTLCEGKERVSPACRDKKEDQLCWAPNPDCKQESYGCTLSDTTENSSTAKSCGGEYKGKAHECGTDPTDSSCTNEEALPQDVNIPMDTFFTWLVGDRGGLQAFTKDSITQNEVGDLFKFAFINLITKKVSEWTGIDLSQWLPALMSLFGWSDHMSLEVKPGTKLYSLQAVLRNSDAAPYGPQRVGCFHDSSLYKDGVPDLVAMKKCAFAHAEYTVNWGDLEQFGGSYRGDNGNNAISELGNGLANAGQIDWSKFNEALGQLRDRFKQLGQQFEDVSKNLQSVADQAQQQYDSQQAAQDAVAGPKSGGKIMANPPQLILDIGKQGQVTVGGGQVPYIPSVVSGRGVATYAQDASSAVLTFTAQAPGKMIVKVQDKTGDYYNIPVSVKDAKGNIPASTTADNGFANPTSGLEGARPTPSLNPTNEQWNYCYYTPE